MPRTRTLPLSIVGLVDRQDGLVTRGQLAAGGIDSGFIHRRVRSGRWRWLLPGVVMTTPGRPTRRQLLLGAILWAGPGAAVDGIDACSWYGLRLDRHDLEHVHLVVPELSRMRSRGFVTVRRAAAEIVVGDAGLVPYVDVATAVIVAARGAPSLRAAIGVLSRALQEQLVDVRTLTEARERIGDKWCRGLDGALAVVGVGIRSSLEHDNCRLVRSSRILPEPLWNAWLDLGDGGGLVCVDALWPDAALVEEVLGKRYHAWGEQFESTEARRSRLVAAGLFVHGATAAQIRTAGPLVQRLEQTYLRNAGRGLPDGVRVVNRELIRF